ncbi:MAG TPA: hypothetical protein VG456_20130 [Candidatus Sulfopaludibacter sp.]|jgi:hypothetical protein|nr:hypothetical protein [Candidatus Sulfopaludibacter sp.]
MQGGNVADIVRRAEHLLWVVARCDVEGLSSTRQTVLIELRALEERAAQLQATDLYREVFQNTAVSG